LAQLEDPSLTTLLEGVDEDFSPFSPQEEQGAVGGEVEAGPLVAVARVLEEGDEGGELPCVPKVAEIILPGEA
jgi:hypothetical protein